jgi:hypothetical protein
MPWSSPIPVYIWAAVMIPLAVLIWFIFPRYKLPALVLVLDYTLISLFCFWTINWVMVSYYLRILTLLLPFALLLRVSVMNAKTNAFTNEYHPWLPPKGKQMTIFIAIAAACVILIIPNVIVFQSHRFGSYKGEPVLVMVPAEGMWVVTNGGNGIDGWGMNNVFDGIFGAEGYSDPSYGYSVDLMKMNSQGTLSNQGSLSKDYRIFEGFNYMIRTPCQGQVVFVQDGYADVEVGEHIEGQGNRVVVQCKDYYVTVDGLRGIVVKVGDSVNLNATLGYLGNNIPPSIPHIEIHATVGGYGPDSTAVPMLFDPFFFDWWEFAVRNHVFIRSGQTGGGPVGP